MNDERVNMKSLAIVLALFSVTSVASAEIRFRSFSSSAAIGPPADAFAAKLQSVTAATVGEVHFVRIPGLPPIPSQFAGDIVATVAAGEVGGGLDAAYISGSDLNKTWGFVFNSGVPFGPTFDEFVGFLYGRSVDGQRTGLDLAQELVARRGVVAVPIVGSPEQLSGYFPEPMTDVHGRRGIGLSGLCQQKWVLRYLPPGENVLGLACDKLVGKRKNISFVAAVPGGGSLVDGLLAGTLNGFEFATPLDDVSQLFNTPNNPGNSGARYVHTPGWQQQFLITWMIINANVWNSLTPAQQIVFQTVARDHVISSYAENLRQQGAALQFILSTNVVVSHWSMRDQARLRDATIEFLNNRVDDAALPAADRTDYARILDSLRLYVRENASYWDKRQVDTSSRFDDWKSKNGQCWEAKCETRRH